MVEQLKQLDDIEEIDLKNKEKIKKYLDKFSICESIDIEKGGIYLETTDDPIGWFLGDKTRRSYKSTIGQIAILTRLLITISPHWDGIKVKVHNPSEIDRMLTSKNDDVGSSVEYAKYDGSIPVELNAQKGQHVNIESITNGDFIRVKIYPGINLEL